MALNGKTQIFRAGLGNKSPSKAISSSVVGLVDMLEVLGWRFYHRLRSDLHNQALISASAAIAGTASELKIHLLANRQ